MYKSENGELHSQNNTDMKNPLTNKNRSEISVDSLLFESKESQYDKKNNNDLNIAQMQSCTSQNIDNQNYEQMHLDFYLNVQMNDRRKSSLSNWYSSCKLIGSQYQNNEEVKEEKESKKLRENRDIYGIDVGPSPGKLFIARNKEIKPVDYPINPDKPKISDNIKIKDDKISSSRNEVAKDLWNNNSQDTLDSTPPIEPAKRKEASFVLLANCSSITSKKQTAEIFGELLRWKAGSVLWYWSFGDVVKAINIKSGKMMAVKRYSLYRSSYEYNKEAIEALKNEIKILKFIEHRHVVEYIGSEIIGNNFWMYLEYAAEGSLYSLYKEYGPLEEEIIKIYTKQILEGLKFLHSKFIVHQDIKCANILLLSNGEIKISDFGCAKILANSASWFEHQPTIKGTIPWIAPEVLKYKLISVKADIWSLGWTVLEMATAQSPWSHQQIGNNIEDIFKLCDSWRHPDIPEHLSKDLKDFLNKWFEFDPNKRLSSSELLTHNFIWN